MKEETIGGSGFHPQLLVIPSQQQCQYNSAAAVRKLISPLDLTHCPVYPFCVIISVTYAILWDCVHVCLHVLNSSPLHMVKSRCMMWVGFKCICGGTLSWKSVGLLNIYCS